MKKLLSLILCLSLSLILFACATTVSADEITVEIDGKKIEFDVKPDIIDGRTMVPLRKIFEEIGASVKWNDETKTVSARKSSKTITLAIDSAEMVLDKGKTDDEGNPVTETVTLDVPARIVSGRTLVPIRAISESLGLDVEWDENNKKVIITSDKDEDDSWKENVCLVDLSSLIYEGEGVETEGNQIKITKGGDYTLKGELRDGNIIISTDEKVKLRLSGAKITSSENPCIFAEKADKIYITLEDGTENYLTAENSESGAVYSKENLEIKGGGKLYIESYAGHGIKASDNLTIENGEIYINASSDGIHVNDTFKMSGGSVDITAVGDGIDCESIVNISGGTVNIETNGTPIQTSETANDTSGEQRRGMWGEAADVEFESSTKGINAEWMMCISGGDININSASHAIHCQDEIEISGGSLTISSKYDKGISAHGNLTVSGADTVIDIEKSTEGIESKNVLTVNDGNIYVVASDDALNATGGNSGAKMPGGNFGGNGEGENGMMQGGFGEGRAQGGNRRGQGAPPQRGGKGSMQPPLDMSENGEFAPPQFDRSENGEFAPPQFDMNGNGEFAPPQFDRGDNGEFTPQQMGGNGGFTPPEGFMGRGDMKTCLIINGGNLELCAANDCLDANGSLEINGGTVKATDANGSFAGTFAIVDPDGQAAISENANLIFAANGGSAGSLSLAQNSITVYCENSHAAGDKITVSDESGNTVYEYTPSAGYKAVLIASQNIRTGEKYVISIGDEAFEAEITEQSTVIGTQSTGGMGFGRGQGMR